MSSERRKNLLPSRREIRNRHFSFLQIKNSSTPSSPLRADRFRTTREAGVARDLASSFELLILFSIMKFHPITHVQPRKLRFWLAPVNHGYRPSVRICVPTPLWNSRSLPAMPKTTYRQARIGLFPLALPGRCCLLPLHSWIPRKQAGLNGTRLRAISPRLEYYRPDSAIP
jgi:hypothetical protein